ncbi:MAG: histidine phosphatase family protein [Gemmatimonadetes bacterium]|nr:histidine phosphatase family protein [Gemmatimonadota bacterium]
MVRHAEQANEAEDPALTSAGQQRADMLAEFLRDARITGIFTSEAQRTRQTARPLAEALSLTAVEIPRDEVDHLISAVRQQQPEGRVLIVGHSQTIPLILRALGFEDYVEIQQSEYDNVFQVLPRSEGTPLVFRYHLTLPPEI